MSEIFSGIGLAVFTFIVFIVGWAKGYSEGYAKKLKKERYHE